MLERLIFPPCFPDVLWTAFHNDDFITGNRGCSDVGRKEKEGRGGDNFFFFLCRSE